MNKIVTKFTSNHEVEVNAVFFAVFFCKLQGFSWLFFFCLKTLLEDYLYFTIITHEKLFFYFPTSCLFL